jgi:hypothetical protein
MKKIIFYTLLGFIFFIYSSLTFADSIVNKGFTVSPPFQEVVIDRDQTKASFSVEITNNGLLSQTLSLSIVDFGTLDESGGVAFLGTKPNDWQKKYGLASWVSLEKDIVIIAAKSSEKINVTIDNKDSLSPGGHYAGLMATLINDTQSGEKKTVGINQVFASLIFAKKIGGEKYDLFLNRADLNNFYTLKIPDEVKLRFQNRGNVHVVPRGTITIMDPFKRIVASGVINPESAIIIPESFRIYPVVVRAISPAFVPGRYTMTAQYRYDGKEDFSKGQYSLYFFGLFSTIAGLIIFGLLFRYSRLIFPRRG